MRTFDKIRGLAEQWKMAFNPDPTRQAQEVFFSKKPGESFHPNLYFNEFVVEKVKTENHLGLKLDKKTILPKLIGELEFWNIERILTTPFINYPWQLFYKTSPRLCWHYLWPTKKLKSVQQNWNLSVQCSSIYYRCN